MSEATYCAHARPNRPEGVPEFGVVVLLLTLPGIRLHRAAALAGWPAPWLVLLFATLLYGGALVSLCQYWIQGYTLLGSVHGGGILFLAWILYAVGPAVAIVGVASVWWLHEFACAVGESDGENNCDSYGIEPWWMIVSLALDLAVVVLALRLRASLNNRYKIKTSSCCANCCLVVCTPLCSVGNVIQKACEAYEQELHDQIPAYPS